MKNVALIKLTVFLMLPALLCCSCARQRAESSQLRGKATKTPETKLIGVSVPWLRYTFFNYMNTEIEQKYPTETVEVKVFDGQNDQQKQNTDVESMVTGGYDGIVLIPLTAEGASPAIAYANEKNVPVITVDREVTDQAGVDVIGFVGSDHVPMGESAAEILVSSLEQMFPERESWNVIEIMGTQDASSTLKRYEGIHNVLDADERINLLASYNGNYSTDEAFSITEDCILAYSDIQGFICHNDDMAIGCYKAAVSAGMDGSFVITGIDGTEACVKIIEDGGIKGTVIQYPAMVLLGIKKLCDYLDGRTIDYYNYYPTEKIPQNHAKAFLDAGKPY